MKKIFIPTLAIVILSASCAKEPQVINNPSSALEGTTKVVEVKATINNDDVKTDYSISGSTAYFHWTGIETIGRLWYSGSGFGHDAFTSTTSADSDETTLVFSGAESVDQTDYAMYPIWNGTSKTGIGWSSSPFKLYLHESMAYDAEHPLKNVVPMIAKLNAGEFEFVPVSGIIAVTVKNLPPSATKITLSSSLAMSGTYRLTSTPSNYAPNIDYVMTNGLTTRLAWNDGNTTSTKSYTFSGLNREQHIFYFPVSVAKNGDYDDRYNGMTITIYAGNDVLQTVTTTSKITVERGQIVRFPTMDLAKATSIKLTGSASAPFAYVEKFGPDAHIKYAIAATEDAAKTAAATGSVVNTYGEANKFSIIPSAGTAGYYYLGYQVLDSSDNVLMTSAIKFCYSASDPAEMVGTYAYSSTFPWATETVSWTFAESDDFTKGNIKITATSIWSLVGNIYGVYDGSKITFDGRRTVFRPNNRHCIIGRWNSATNAQGSNVGELIDVVFTKAGSNLTTSKIGIGYDTSDLVEPLTTVYLSSRYFPDPITWVKQP